MNRLTFNNQEVIKGCHAVLYGLYLLWSGELLLIQLQHMTKTVSNDATLYISCKIGYL